MSVRIGPAPQDFSAWPELLRLLTDAFAFMAGRIDPPSSVLRLTPDSIAEKAREETLFLAEDGNELIGCVFARPQGESLYIGKLAVRENRRRTGIGKALMDAVEHHALSLGLRRLELETRIELTENHATFASLGYVRTGEHAHEGYDRPTSVTMRKVLPG
jgi:GNAT superfamily N-acetyltransferase